MPGGGRCAAGTLSVPLSRSRPCAPSGAATASARKASTLESLAIVFSNCRAERRNAPRRKHGRCQPSAPAADLQAIVSQLVQKDQNARDRSVLSPRLESNVLIR